MTTENLTASSTDAEARANLFPQYLMKLLNEEVAPEALYWIPDGLAFALDPTKIDSQVLDKYFQKTKYSSFIRRLHNEGFRRQTRRYKKMEGLTLAEGTVVLSHDQFQRKHPELLENFYGKKAPVVVPAAKEAAKEANKTARDSTRTSPAANDYLSSKTSPSTATVPAPATAAAPLLNTPSLLGLTQQQQRLRADAAPTSPQGLLRMPAFAASTALPGATTAATASMESLSKSIAALRQARFQRELASEDTFRRLLLQQQQTPNFGGSPTAGVSRSSSNEAAAGAPAAAGTSLNAGSSLLDSRLQALRRQQQLEDQILGMQALRRAAYGHQGQWP